MEILAKTYRGDTVDLLTHGTIAVVNSQGKILYSVGNPNEIAFARSSAKLIQGMLPLYEELDQKYGFESKEISQMCASHSGEDIHVSTIRSILEKISLNESFLKCGSHYPFKEEIAIKMKENGDNPLDIHNNCSGKHAGMLAVTKAAGDSLEDYYKTDHPTQLKILDMISKVCDYPVEDIEIGIDGCGVPVHALPIYNFAYGMARMCDSESLGGKYGVAASKVTHAIMKNPVNASGSDRIDYYLMDKYPGKIVVKSGANGYYSGYFPGENIGFALKTYDGDTNIRNLVVVELLKQLGIIQAKDANYFDSIYKINVLNHRNEIVGNTKATFILEDKR